MSGQVPTRSSSYILLGFGILAVLTLIVAQGHQFAWGQGWGYYRNVEGGLSSPGGYLMGSGHMGGGPYAIGSSSTDYMDEMHDYMMGGDNESRAKPELTKDEAYQIAQAYLGENLPGATVLKTSFEYPYMFVVTQGDVAVGMLMVDGVDGAVRYHEWGSGLSSMMEECW